MSKIADVTVQNAIVHITDKNEAAPVYSDVALDLPAEKALRDYFTGQVRNALNDDHTGAARFAATGLQDAKNACLQILASAASFVSIAEARAVAACRDADASPHRSRLACRVPHLHGGQRSFSTPGVDQARSRERTRAEGREDTERGASRQLRRSRKRDADGAGKTAQGRVGSAGSQREIRSPPARSTDRAGDVLGGDVSQHHAGGRWEDRCPRLQAGQPPRLQPAPEGQDDHADGSRYVSPARRCGVADASRQAVGFRPEALSRKPQRTSSTSSWRRSLPAR